MNISKKNVQKPLLYGDLTAKSRVFDLLLNLSIHGELLYAPPAAQQDGRTMLSWLRFLFFMITVITLTFGLTSLI